MIARCILSAAVVLTGHLAVAGPPAAQAAAAKLAGAGVHRPAPELMGVQYAEPEAGDRLGRLGQHRSVLEAALRAPRQAVVAPPVEPQTRPLLSTAAEVDCDEAATIVADYGFAAIRPSDCSGAPYRFSAMRDGSAYAIEIDAAGEIAKVSRQ